MRRFYSLFLLSLSMLTLQAQVRKQGVDWPVFMQRHTLKWDTLGSDYSSAIILGNGLLGLRIYQSDVKRIRFDLERTDVAAQPQVGHMLLTTLGKITGAKMQLSIYDAKASGTIYTSKGSISFTAFVHAGKQVIYTSTQAKGLEGAAVWQFIANENADKGIRSKQGQYSVFRKVLPGKGGTATVWKRVLAAKEKILTVSVGYDSLGKQTEVSSAIKALKSFNQENLTAELRAHSNWWHEFYQQSFLSVPDQRIESFYWIQRYYLQRKQFADSTIGHSNYESLNVLLEKDITPNALASDSIPISDAALAAATSIQEMLLQSSEGKIKIFPAVPEEWAAASFDKLDVGGNFLVSAQRTEGKTSYIKVYSIKGGSCKIESDMQVNRVSSDKTDSPALTMSQREGWTSVLIQTVPGETLWLSGIESNPGGITAVKPAILAQWTWGLKKKF